MVASSASRCIDSLLQVRCSVGARTLRLQSELASEGEPKGETSRNEDRCNMDKFQRTPDDHGRDEVHPEENE